MFVVCIVSLVMMPPVSSIWKGPYLNVFLLVLGLWCSANDVGEVVGGNAGLIVNRLEPIEGR